MRKRFATMVLKALVTITGLATVSQPALAQSACLRGVNLAGAEFGKPGDAYGKGYLYPSDGTITYFAGKGFNTVRLPFLWERLQPRLYAALDKAETKRLSAAIDAIQGAHMVVILDPHNYARYNGKLIGSDGVPQSAFADFWRRLSTLFANKEGVIFGLMNEPHDISAEDWVSAANSAITTIRQTGARNFILVPGTAWTGAHSWLGGDYGTPNGDALKAVSDPLDNFVYELHQYLDTDFSGKNDECSRAADAVKAIGDVSDWLRAQKRTGFLGEFGVPFQPQCQPALTDMVKVVEANRDVWLGWSYWAGGDWWKPDEALNIQPTKTGDRPQMQTLSQAVSQLGVCSRP